jgi:hypothetical protein
MGLQGKRWNLLETEGICQRQKKLIRGHQNSEVNGNAWDLSGADGMCQEW